ISGNALFTGGVYWDEYVPAEDDWKHAFVPLMSQNFLSSGFQLKFVFTSGNANAVYIDDILIEPTPVTDVSDWNDAKAGLRVYPNPTGGAVRVELPERVKDIGDVQVLDYTGRPANGFHNLGSDRQTLLLDLSGLAPGMYFVRVGDLVGRVMVAR
ncbi:MAG TPA: T9SS type A sorting domain-containing protein, partial [Cryomorphaceae bacterium]|nr:T9SS type A sorting domain-containing protein [Cryomorphaceae bacterium]